VADAYLMGGHSFNMAWEADENTGACGLNGGCHGPVPDFDISNVQTDTDSLISVLDGMLQAAGLLDGTGHPVSGVVTNIDSAGAVWNYLMAHEDRSIGAHNMNYIQSLLKSAIDYMNGTLPQPTAVPAMKETETYEETVMR